MTCQLGNREPDPQRSNVWQALSHQNPKMEAHPELEFNFRSLKGLSGCPVPDFARLVLASIDDVFAQAMKIQNWLNEITRIFSKMQART